MNEDRYRFCRIFVKGVTTEAVMAMLTTLVKGEFRRRSMFLPGLVVDVLRNGDAAGAGDPGDDFVRWPVSIELEAAADAGEEVMVETVSKVLWALWNAGHGAVAACDFEDELPWNGGISRIQG